MSNPILGVQRAMRLLSIVALAAISLVFSTTSAAHAAMRQPVHVVSKLTPARHTAAAEKIIKQVSFKADASGWVILYDLNGFSVTGLPTAFSDKLNKINTDGDEIEWVALDNTIDGDPNWLVSSTKAFSYSDGLPTELIDKLKELDKKGEAIKGVSFYKTEGWVVLYGDNGFASLGLPDDVSSKLDELNSNGDIIKQVSFTPDGSWVVVRQKNAVSWSKGILIEVTDLLKKINDAGDDIRQVDFVGDNGWVVLSGKNVLDGKHLPQKFVDKVNAIAPQ